MNARPIDLESKEEGPQLLASLKQTKKFDSLPQSSEDAMRDLREMIALVAND